MASLKEQVIHEFLEVFLEDDQLWSAGGAAEIQQLLHENIDDRGRLNGKRILNHMLSSGVPPSAARAAMDRFVAKRRASMGASNPGVEAPEPSNPSVPRAPAQAPSSGRSSGLGVVSASAAAHRQGPSGIPRMSATEASAETSSRVLPWGGAVPVPASDPEATHVVAEDLNTQQLPSAPPSSTRSAATATFVPGMAAEVSDPSRRAPTIASGHDPSLPTLDLSAHAVPAPPTPAAPQPEISSPGSPRKRLATEIRGTPIAAAASTKPPAPARTVGPPSAMKPSSSSGGRDALPPEMAKLLGKEPEKAAGKESSGKNRVTRPSVGAAGAKGSLGGLIVAVGSVAATAAALAFGGSPQPQPANLAAGGGVACEALFSTSGELFCVVAEGYELNASPDQLRERALVSLDAAKKAGFKGMWFFTSRHEVWHPPLPRPILATQALAPASAAPAAPAAAKPSSAPPPNTEAAVDDILKGLQIDSSGQEPPETASGGKKTKKKRGARRRQRADSPRERSDD